MYFLKLAQQKSKSSSSKKGDSGVSKGELSKLRKNLKSSLKPHQKRVLEKLKENKAVLVFHGLGSGKTYTALAAAEQEGGGSAVGPAALKKNFSDEGKKHKVKTKVDYSTYSKPEPKSDRLLIYDEAHRMGRMDSDRSRYPEKFKADKTLLLTGTPIRNEPSELVPLMRAMGINIPRDKKKFYEHFVEEEKIKPGLWGRLRGVKPGTELKGKNLEYLEKALEGKVDYHKNTKEGYPEVEEEDVKVPMSPLQHETYQMAMKQNPTLAYKIKYGIPPSKAESAQMNAFLNATRQISNTPGSYNLSAGTEDSAKIQRMVQDIVEQAKKDKNYKGVTYSNFLDSGVNSIAKQLEQAEIPYVKFTGSMTDKQKQEAIKAYNKGKVKHLLISGAGAEGLDLKGTKLLQTTEPHWNKAKLDQVRGRAVRYQSHADLPEAERKVKIKNYYSTLPENKFKEFFTGKQKSTDEYLKALSESKSKLNKDFLNVLRAASDPNLTIKDLQKAEKQRKKKK